MLKQNLYVYVIHSMNNEKSISSRLKYIASAGLIAKGIVYCLLGLLTFMAAFNIQGKSAENTNKSGVFGWINNMPGGNIILGAIGIGLICYCFWRFMQAFFDTEEKGKDASGIGKRLRYGFSALVYSSLAFYAFKMVFSQKAGSGDSNQQAVATLLDKPYGQILVGVFALIVAAIGIYQIYYGLSEKYKKHVEEASNIDQQKILLKSGKIGFFSRGVVWLLIAWLIAKAAINASSSSAGDTSKALQTLQDAPYGSYLLAAVGLGLICYGTFNFLRARYEKF